MAGAVGWTLYRMWRERRTTISVPVESFARSICTPDAPVAFGYKVAWLAIRADDSESVCQALGIDDAEVANWESGIAAAHRGHTFISPPVNGWILLVSSSFPEVVRFEDSEISCRWLEHVAKHFPRVYYFATNRVTEYHAWAQLTSGTLVRAFAYLGESAEILANVGQPTLEELSFVLPMIATSPGPLEAVEKTDDQTEMPAVPDEEYVIELARLWTITPLELPKVAPLPSTGWLSRTWPAA